MTIGFDTLRAAEALRQAGIAEPHARAIVTTMTDAIGEHVATKTDIAGVKTDIAGVKTDIAGMKTDIAGMKTDIAGMKTDIAGMKTEMVDVKTTRSPRSERSWPNRRRHSPGGSFWLWAHLPL